MKVSAGQTTHRYTPPPNRQSWLADMLYTAKTRLKTRSATCLSAQHTADHEPRQYISKKKEHSGPSPPRRNMRMKSCRRKGVEQENEGQETTQVGELENEQGLFNVSFFSSNAVHYYTHLHSSHHTSCIRVPPRQAHVHAK
ncbi:hypothetical protein BDP27DRAFT_500429 [Rhodocollybia butyracea]|uniref:Uncharacterized protein n=1 Tax=Rhodocollybia butyracea TaxID=206335 RepID=A0A9P5PYH9_9AGAR|nr:hypothetical protein BDP27DRAFT_500429 [Rhodocollybia butyracea]